MLCDVCSSINFDKMIAWDRRDDRSFYRRGGAYHHESYTALLEAARRGCDLCTAIHEEQLAQGPGHHKETPDMEAIENRFGKWKHLAGQIYCEFYESRSMVSFQRFTGFGHSRTTGMANFGAGDFNVKLRIFAYEDSPAAKSGGITGRPIAHDPTSEASISRIQSWMADCFSQHNDRGEATENCQPDLESTLPTRVIDVGQDGLRDPFLHISNGEEGRWVVLSHCWGTESRFVTEANSLNERKISIPLDQLPATFRDAIIMTRRLGFRYVWIDSLCILQDQREDWAKELQQMYRYYKHSSLMIAVDGAEGDHRGFLRKRTSDTHLPIRIPFKSRAITTPSYVYIQRQEQKWKFQNHLKTRGWTLQEDIIAPRAVHFKDHLFTWECPRGILKESTTLSSRSKKVDFLWLANCTSALSDAKKRYAAGVWCQVIMQFSSRSLTFPDDKLPAVSALAREIQEKTGWTYKAGLWLEDIHRGLLWEAVRKGGRSAMYRAPSWSWACQDSSVHQGRGLLNWKTLESIAEIRECSVVPQDGDLFGCITSGFLRIRGPWKMVKDWTGFTPYFNRRGNGPYKTYLYGFPSIYPELLREYASLHPTQLICNLDEDNPEPSEALTERISLIQISKTANTKKKDEIILALVLQAVEGTESVSNIALLKTYFCLQPISGQNDIQNIESNLTELTGAISAYGDVAKMYPTLHYYSARVLLCLVAPMTPSFAEECWLTLHYGENPESYTLGESEGIPDEDIERKQQ